MILSMAQGSVRVYSFFVFWGNWLGETDVNCLRSISPARCAHHRRKLTRQ